MFFVLCCILLMLPPYIGFAFLFSLFKLRKPKLKMVVVLLFILSIIGIYWFPWGDNQSHFVLYYANVVNRYYDFTIDSSFWFYDYVISLIARLTGNYIWGFFFWVFVPYTIFVALIWKYLMHKKIQNYYLLLISLIMFIGIRELLDLNRNTVAILMLINSFLLYKYYSKKVLSVIFFLSAILLHDSVKYLVLFYPIGLWLYRRNNKHLYILLFVTIMCSTIIVIVAPYFVSTRYMEAYFSSGLDTDTGVNSGFMKVLTYVNIFIFVVQFLFIQKHKKLLDTHFLHKIYLTSVFIVCASFSFWIGRERFMLMSNVLAITIILLSWSNFETKKSLCKRIKQINQLYVLKILIICMLMYSSHEIHNTATKNNAQEYKIVSHSLYMPTIFLFNINQYGYSDEQFLLLYSRVQGGVQSEE